MDFLICVSVFTGDLQVDDHQAIIEDTGIVLGTAIKEAAADKKEYGGTEAVFFPWMKCWYSVL